KAALIQPGGQGAHSWHPFSFNPQTGLVYFSAVAVGVIMANAKTFTFQPMSSNTGISFPPPDQVSDEMRAKAPRSGQSQLVAWDPVQNKQVWRATPVCSVRGPRRPVATARCVGLSHASRRSPDPEAGMRFPCWSSSAGR